MGFSFGGKFLRFCRYMHKSRVANLTSQRVIQNGLVKWKDAEGKVQMTLNMNTASQCGFIKQNDTELADLHEKYQNQGRDFLASPCNQFKAHEPVSFLQFDCTRFIAGYTVFSKDANVHDVDFSKFRGKVQIMRNTASQCGLINLNYRELAQLYEKYKHLGLEFLALQHSQFAEQDVSNNEILQFEHAGDPMLDKGGSPDQGSTPDQGGNPSQEGGNPGQGGGSESPTLVKEITWEVCALADSNGGPSRGFYCFRSISAAAVNMAMQEAGRYGSSVSPVWRPDATHAMAVTDSNLGSAGTLDMLAFILERKQIPGKICF